MHILPCVHHGGVRSHQEAMCLIVTMCMPSDTANKPADGGVKVAAPTFLCSLSSDNTLFYIVRISPISHERGANGKTLGLYPMHVYLHP